MYLTRYFLEFLFYDWYTHTHDSVEMIGMHSHMTVELDNLNLEHSRIKDKDKRSKVSLTFIIYKYIFKIVFLYK